MVCVRARREWIVKLVLLLGLHDCVHADVPVIDCEGNGFSTINGFVTGLTDRNEVSGETGYPYMTLPVLPPVQVDDPNDTNYQWEVGLEGTPELCASDNRCISVRAFMCTEYDTPGTFGSGDCLDGAAPIEFAIGDGLQAPVSGHRFYLVAENLATGEKSDPEDCTVGTIITDNERPTIGCPGDMVVNPDEGQPHATVSLQSQDVDQITGAVYDDNSVINGDLSTLQISITNCGVDGNCRSSDPIILTVPNDDGTTTVETLVAIGVSTVEYEVVQLPINQQFAQLESATCTFTITVQDVELPSITCPAAETVETDIGGNTATRLVAVTDAAATDNSGFSEVYKVTASDGGGSVSPILLLSDPSDTDTDVLEVQYHFSLVPSNTYVQYTARDGDGNERPCTQVITVIDQEDPVVTCPTDLDLDTEVGQPHVGALIRAQGYTDDQGVYQTGATFVDNSGETSTITLKAHLESPVGTIIAEGTAPVEHNFGVCPADSQDCVGGSSVLHEVYFVAIGAPNLRSASTTHCTQAAGARTLVHAAGRSSPPPPPPPPPRPPPPPPPPPPHPPPSCSSCSSCSCSPPPPSSSSPPPGLPSLQRAAGLRRVRAAELRLAV
jgi:hypothetical protein